MFYKLLALLERIYRKKDGDDGGHGTVLLVKTVHSPQGRNRVCFFHRKEDGIYGYREEIYDDKSLEAHWIPMRHGHVEEYPSMDAAVAAAKAEVHWLHLVMQ